MKLGVPEGSNLNAQGELALPRGRRKKAIQLLQQGIAATRTTGYPTFFLASESLARAWGLEGNPENALRVLTEAAAEKVRAAFVPVLSIHTWMKIQAERARLLRQLGRAQKAQAIEAALHKLLAYADPDHPILRQLKQSEESPVAQR